MFGVQSYRNRPLVEELTRSMIKQGYRDGKYVDQQVLAAVFWPVVKKEDVVTLEDWSCFR